ncbi:MAG: 16S rRNA (adenine(1518)-N(6)/adenine(1519)-N(6))-dimethyltransferase RsmA [Anaerolineae bacterium]
MTESVAALLRARGLRPRKRLGQNFLTDPVALERIVAAADLAPSDLVVEVGAGVGTLTGPLAERAARVLALELDDGLVDILRERFSAFPNVEIIHGDVLRLSLSDLVEGSYKVVGNLPYYITSAVLRRFLSGTPRPRLMVVTVQREVAERAVAEPGEMSLLAVSVQFYGQPSIVARIPAGAFYPVPKVDSAVMRIDIGEQPVVHLGEGIDEAEFFRVVRAGFSQKRKKLRNSLSAGLRFAPAEAEQALEQAGVDPGRRAETLSLPEWARVTKNVHALGRAVR